MSGAAMGDGLPVVSVSASTAQSMGVRTGKVVKRNLARSITTVGYVRYDEDKLHHLHANAAGWVKNPKVRALGEKVEAGQQLASYYSPQIYTAQEDYLTALRASGERQRQTDVLTRLRVMEIPDNIIRTLEQDAKITPYIPVVTPISGVVTQIGAQDGTYVSPSDVMYSIADLSTVWVIVDVFPEQMSWVQKGARANMTIDALPEQKWSGRVDYVYPELNAKTRTAQVRLIFDNADNLLKPNMFANVKITNRPATGVLAIPREALIPTGDGYRVVKVTEEDHYKPVEVTVGIRTEKTVQILEGLEQDDEVVLSGQFLIDSESNLQASFQRMSN
jgi:Cu(I)/Ag(I) efflux system membrane fusion protein